MSTTDSSDSGGYDPVAAFEHRRSIFNTVQEIQRREHEAMASIARSIESRKRELLIHLSQWLTNQSGDHPTHVEVQRLCGCPISEWVQLQAAAKTLEADVRRLESAVAAAHAAYRAEEPLGHFGLGGVAEAFAPEEKRRKLQALNANTVSKTDQLNGANGRFQENVRKRQQYGKRFLRSCLQNVRELEDSTVFGITVQRLVKEMNSSIETEWQRHLSYNKDAMKSMIASYNGLWTGYYGAPRNGR